MADSTSIGGLTSLRSAWSRCPYWMQGDVEVRRLLPGVVLSEIGGTPARHPAVPDPPHVRVDVASIEPMHKAAVPALAVDAGTWDFPIHAVKYVALPGSQNFQQYIHIDRSLKPLLMRPSLVLRPKGA